MSTDIRKLLDIIDDVSPYSTYLDEDSLSAVDEWIDSGNMVLNALISGSMYKGIPKGRVVQFVGASQTFKTNIVLQIAANAQKQGITPIIFDSEGAIDPQTAKAAGLDLSEDCDFPVKYVNPITIEELKNGIFKFLSAVLESGLKGKFIIIIDSLANFLTDLETGRMLKDSTAQDMGNAAKSIKSLLRMLTVMGNLTGTTTVFSNWIYDDPAAMFPSIIKNIAGGRSTEYLPSVIVQLARKPIKEADSVDMGSKLAVAQKSYAGIVIRMLTAKNRFIKQFLEGEMYISFSNGLHKYYGLLEIMKGMGVVENKGAIYYDWNGEKLGYYKAWKDDLELWDQKLLPELDSRLMSEWSYGNMKDEPPDEDEQIREDEEPETPIEKLKKLKKKVSNKLDKIEEEEVKED